MALAAKLLEKRYSKQCELCYLIDSEAKNIKFFMYDEGYYKEAPKYICEECLKMLRDIREKCNKEFSSPGSKVLEGYTFWHHKETNSTAEKISEQNKGDEETLRDLNK